MCELNKTVRNEASHTSGHIVAINKICSAERRNLPITAQDIQSAMVAAACILSVLNKNPKISVTPPCKQQIDRAYSGEIQQTATIDSLINFDQSKFREPAYDSLLVSAQPSTVY